MFVRSLKKFAIAAAAVATTGWGLTGVAEAGWRHHGSWGSSGGYYGSWGGSSGGSSGGGWGWRHHRRRWHGSSGGSSGGWSNGSSGGSSGGWSYTSGGSSGGSSGGWTVAEPAYVEGTPSTLKPAEPPAAPVEGDVPAPSAPATDDLLNPTTTPPAGASLYLPADELERSALLNVQVPAGAQVVVNGLPTRSTGNDRQFVSRGLEPGYRYKYEVKATLVVDGKTIEQVKTVRLQGGQRANVSFDMEETNAVAKDEAPTTLVLNVPADAKVTLAGNEMKATGSVREFTTTKLPAGATWADYDVRVEYTQDGRTQVKEESVSLKAGEKTELSFDFAAPAASVASAK